MTLVCTETAGWQRDAEEVTTSATRSEGIKVRMPVLMQTDQTYRLLERNNVFFHFWDIHLVVEHDQIPAFFAELKLGSSARQTSGSWRLTVRIGNRQRGRRADRFLLLTGRAGASFASSGARSAARRQKDTSVDMTRRLRLLPVALHDLREAHVRSCHFAHCVLGRKRERSAKISSRAVGYSR